MLYRSFLSSEVDRKIKLSDQWIKNGFPHSLIILYPSLYSEVYGIEEEVLLLVVVVETLPSSWSCAGILALFKVGDRRSFKRLDMKRYKTKLAAELYQSTNYLRKALLCLCQGVELFYYFNNDVIRNLLILYNTYAIAWVSIYSSYLPTPVKMAWVVLSSYYRHTFVDDASSSKNQATSLWLGVGEMKANLDSNLSIYPTLMF